MVQPQTISDMLREALHYLARSEMEEGARARQLRAEALHYITGVLKEIVFMEEAIAKIVHDKEAQDD